MLLLLNNCFHFRCLSFFLSCGHSLFSAARGRLQRTTNSGHRPPLPPPLRSSPGAAPGPSAVSAIPQPRRGGSARISFPGTAEPSPSRRAQPRRGLNTAPREALHGNGRGLQITIPGGVQSDNGGLRERGGTAEGEPRLSPGVLSRLSERSAMQRKSRRAQTAPCAPPRCRCRCSALRAVRGRLSPLPLSLPPRVSFVRARISVETIIAITISPEPLLLPAAVHLCMSPHGYLCIQIPVRLCLSASTQLRLYI